MLEYIFFCGSSFCHIKVNLANLICIFVEYEKKKNSLPACKKVLRKSCCIKKLFKIKIWSFCLVDYIPVVTLFIIRH